MQDTSSLRLTDSQVQSFITDGFVRIDDAFSSSIAAQCRDELWADIGLSPDRPEDWRQPVIRVMGKSTPPFIAAANTPRLHAAYDQLVGEGRWLAPQGLGTFPIRFPSTEAPGDDGWHVDTSFGDSADFMEWRVNIVSRGRSLLMLFLLSDVGADGFDDSAACRTDLATGPAGTVYLCHPFLVHAAQPHHGTVPRFMAQPPLLPRHGFDPALPPSPVQIAIRRACGL